MNFMDCTLTITKSRLIILAVLVTLVAQLGKAQFSAVTYRVTINSNVKQASLYIDRQYVGHAGITVDLSGGEHDVLLTADGYEDCHEKIGVKKNQTFSFKMKKASCRVTFACDVPGALILVDDRITCTTDNPCNLDAGEHRVRVTAEGYNDYLGTIVVGGDNDHFDFTLEREMCRVTFTCDVPNVLMVIDDKVVGNPYGSNDLLPGKHKILARAKGCQDYVRTIVVDRNHTRFHVGISREIRVESFTVNGVEFTMMPVNGGSFSMGSSKGRQITMSDYHIGQTEVTWQLWQAVMGEDRKVKKDDMLRPVVDVSWDDCVEFIDRLNALTGKRFRLPSEAEWEYAARGGDKSKGYQYAGSSDIERVAWAKQEKIGAHPVAGKAPNELGLYDMSGNVWEWCQDQHEGNGSSSASDVRRVCRGGSWHEPAENCRVTVRAHNLHTVKGIDIGFRLAL